MFISGSKNNNNATVYKITIIVVEKLYYVNLLKKITNYTSFIFKSQEFIPLHIKVWEWIKKVFLFGQHVIPELRMMKKIVFQWHAKKINMNDENLHNNNVVQIVIIWKIYILVYNINFISES